MSNFGSICKATAKRDLDWLAAQLVLPGPFRSRATAYGTVHEPVAIEKFQQVMGPTRDCGIFVHKDYLWLAASPDSVVVEFISLLEVECPYSAKDKNIDHVSVPYLKKTSTGLTVNKNHIHYYHIQGQLTCANVDSCYFSVFTQKDFYTEKISRDDKFICDMLGKLKTFYGNHFKRHC